MNKKFLIIIGILVVLVVTGFIYLTQIGITPTDTKIVQTLDKNKEALLSINGVVGAGIARDENNYIIGIAVYAEDNITNIQKIPNKLDNFKIFIKRMSEATEFEKERMIIRK